MYKRLSFLFLEDNYFRSVIQIRWKDMTPVYNRVWITVNFKSKAHKIFGPINERNSHASQICIYTKQLAFKKIFIQYIYAAYLYNILYKYLCNIIMFRYQHYYVSYNFKYLYKRNLIIHQNRIYIETFQTFTKF